LGALLTTVSFRRVAVVGLLALGSLTATSALAQQGPASRLGDPRTGTPSATQPPPPAPSRSGTPTAPRYDVDAEQVPLPPGYRERGPRAGEEVEERGGPDDEPASTTEVRNRIRALDATWATLGLSGGPNVGSAILSLVGGGIQIGLGALVLELGPPASDFAPYFFVLGGTSILRTVLVEFVLRPDPRGAAIEYQNMPDATRAQAVARMRYGEQQLRGIAEQSMIMRMVDGGLNIASGLAVIPAYLVPRNFELVDFEWLVLIGPAFAVVSGIITLASPTAAERRWEAYDAMRRRLEAQRGRGRATLELEELRMPTADGPSVGASLSVDPNGGGMAFLSGTF
jgi:hypothetical protein